MGTKINVQVHVLSSLSNDYQKYGEQVSHSYKTASDRIERELESIVRTYSDYSSVTSKVYELQNKLKRTEGQVRVLQDRSDELSRGLKTAAEQYIQQAKREEELIGKHKANVEIHAAGVSLKQGGQALTSSVKSVVEGIGKKVTETFSSFANHVADAASEVTVAIGRFGDKAKQTVVSFGETVKNKWNSLVKGTAGFFKKTKDTLTDFFGKVAEKIKQVYEKIAAGVQSLIDTIKENKDKILNGLKQVGIAVLDTVQFALDILGLIPAFGEIADALNAIIYALRKDYVNAGLSLAACIPFAGWAATGGKIGGKLAKFFGKIDVSKVIDTIKDAGSTVIKYGEQAIDFIAKKGSEVWSHIGRIDVVKKVENLITAISHKGYEIQTKIHLKMEQFTKLFGEYWEAQTRMGIVPPGFGDLFNRQNKKLDVDTKPVDDVKGIEGTPKVNPLKVSNEALDHANIGDFTRNPKTGEISKMSGGGHGQDNIAFLEKNGIEYNIELTYPNGVRVGNVPGHKSKGKRTGTGQAWFPETWTKGDISKAGEYVANMPDHVNVADGVTIFGEYNGVRVGVIKTNGEIGTIFPDNMMQP